GNQYVNRNMIGAVVGVQPFGGEGLSGTGPKAGGPLYLSRLMHAPPDAPLDARLVLPIADASEASGAAAVGIHGASPGRRASALAALAALESRLRAASEPQLRALGDVCAALARATPLERPFVLGGPTGERNTWWLTARRAVLGVARDDADRLF